VLGVHVGFRLFVLHPGSFPSLDGYTSFALGSAAAWAPPREQRPGRAGSRAAAAASWPWRFGGEPHGHHPATAQDDHQGVKLDQALAKQPRAAVGPVALGLEARTGLEPKRRIDAVAPGPKGPDPAGEQGVGAAVPEFADLPKQRGGPKLQAELESPVRGQGLMSFLVRADMEVAGLVVHHAPGR
jgi:hypothetical protein